MSDATDSSNAPAPKPRGRPASGKPALTAAQRQHAYRQRLKSAPVDAQGQVTPLGRVALVKMLLNEDLATLDDAGQTVEAHERARWNIARIMRELITRYGIDTAGNA